MHFVKVDNLKIKIFLEFNGILNNDSNQQKIKVDKISREALFLNQSVEPKMIESISQIILSFYVGDSWRSYHIRNIVLNNDDGEDFTLTDKIFFRVSDGEINSFNKDFRLARC